MLFEYFSSGTEGTVTGSHVGLEIETDFLDCLTNQPITVKTKEAILAEAINPPVGCVVQRELGRQKIELAIAPHMLINDLFGTARTSLEWLYGIAAKHGARPLFEPEVTCGDKLLRADEPRDELWVQIDGRAALEELCRCSSVQFTVDVNPQDATQVLNSLWAARLHELDYKPNNRRWRNYLRLSKGGYDPLRYGGPAGFASLEDYVAQLRKQPVLMHKGRAVRLDPESTPDLEVDLFLRSVWWHYRLRRYGSALAVEIRPFARRSDVAIEEVWDQIAPIFGRDKGEYRRGVLATDTDRILQRV